MALFKISKGLNTNLPTTITEGYCWYTYDDSKFYIDYKDEKGVLTRKALNAKDAETLTGASLETILNSSNLEIPTSKAVLDALDKKVDKTTTVNGHALSGNVTVSYDDLTYKPTIPSKTSELTNDSGFKTTDTNTTYSLSKSGSTITLTGSDGSTTSVTDADTNTTYGTATSSTAGLVKIGYTENGKNYPVELSDGQMFVNVPWTDNNTTYSSKTAASGGTDVSLVTTGEKYTWNNKASTSVATTSANGLMSSTDKSKLDGIASGATANAGTVTSVRVQAGTGLSSSVSTAQTGSLNTTISIADGYKLPTTTEWNAKGTSNLTIGTTGTTAAAGNHTHTTTIASSTGTNELTLAHGSTYAITAGGDSFVFTMPATQTSVSGNAGTATKLASAKTISLTGDVTGSVSFDGSDNVSMTTTIADDSHNHTIANVDGLQTALDEKANTSALEGYLPNDVEELDLFYNEVEGLNVDDFGISWSDQFAFYKGTSVEASGTVQHLVPIVAGENVTFAQKAGENGNVVEISTARPIQWYTGTAITGTSTTATIFSSSGVTTAIVGDMYLNTSTANVYQCTVAGDASVATWVYVCNIKGATGTTGASIVGATIMAV